MKISFHWLVPFAVLTMLGGCASSDQDITVGNTTMPSSENVSSDHVPTALTVPAPAKQARSTSSFLWQHFGGAPYAASVSEAMKTRERAFHCLGLPEPVIKKLMVVTKQSGEKTSIKNGDHLDKMLSTGCVASNNVTVAFDHPQVHGMAFTAEAQKWEVTWEGKTYIVYLPEVCGNWSVVIIDTACYRVPLNYSRQQDVVWNGAMPGSHSVVHLPFSQSDMEKLSADDCFGYHDDADANPDRLRKPFNRCDDGCDEGVYPDEVLAVQGGLPPREPPSRFSFYLKNGKGYVSYPVWVLNQLSVTIYCVTVDGYTITVSASTATSRYDVVNVEEYVRTAAGGQLDHALLGSQHFPSVDPRFVK